MIFSGTPSIFLSAFFRITFLGVAPHSREEEGDDDEDEDEDEDEDDVVERGEETWRVEGMATEWRCEEREEGKFLSEGRVSVTFSGAS